jgi:hypothetical protein
MIRFVVAVLVGAVFFAGPSRAAEGEIPLYFQPQPPSQAANVYLVTVDGECEGAGPEAELLFNLWLNTVSTPTISPKPMQPATSGASASS